jgi:site-specific DNA recombinase
VQIEADMVVRNVELVDLEMVKTCAQDLKVLLQEADFTERKSFLRSFIKRIEVNEKQVVVHYKLPIPQSKKMKGEVEVLPFDTPGGAGATEGRTFLLSFS